MKALSDDDTANHLRAINEHRKAIDRHQRGIAAHLKFTLDFDDDDIADPALLEDDDDVKAFVAELSTWPSKPRNWRARRTTRPN